MQGRAHPLHQSDRERERVRQTDIQAETKREGEGEKERDKEREREFPGEGERESDVKYVQIFFLKRMTDSLAPFIYLVMNNFRKKKC